MTQSRRIILGTAGHIDHGKTSLVRSLTGVDTDRLPQERARGITIDVGFASLTLDDLHVGIIDVPGHERFIKNMLAGAVGVDLAMLVIAADDSIMPQTREHLDILRLLRVKTGLVAITKCDLAEPDWIDLVEEDVRELTRGTFLDGAPIVRTSANDGTGTDELRRAIADAADRVSSTTRREPFRLPVDRAFVKEGLGTVVTGTVWSGTLGSGDAVDWLPGATPVRARGLQSFGREATSIERGQRAAINLIGVHHSEIKRGHELAATGTLRPSHRLTVRLRALEGLQRPIKHRSRVRLHVGTAEIIASVYLLGQDEIAPGESAVAQLHAASPLVARARQPFVVRSESPLETIGGGSVLEPVPPRYSRRQHPPPDRFDGLTDDDPVRRVGAALALAAGAVDPTPQLWQTADADPAEAGAALDALAEQGVIRRDASGRTLHSDRVDAIAGRIEPLMRRFHETHPLDTGMPRSRLEELLGDLEPSELAMVIDHLIATERLSLSGTRLAMAGLGPALSPAQLALVEKLLDAYRDGGFTPPTPAALASDLHHPERKLRDLVQLCVDQGRLDHVAGDLFLHADAAIALRERLTAHLQEHGEIAMSGIRDLLGTSRKFAVPLGEYCDRVGITRRKGDVRVLP